MHLLATETIELDPPPRAVDLGQSPGDIVILSYTDSDLAAFEAAWRHERDLLPSLRLANLARLGHPMSVDLYAETVLAHARFILVRLLGGRNYWDYGVEEVSALCRDRGIPLAFLPGDGRADPRLAAASTVDGDDLARLDSWCREGGARNLSNLLRHAACRAGHDLPWEEPVPVPRAGHAPELSAGPEGAATVPVLFYRSLYLAGDVEPVRSLARALAARGLRAVPVFVSSLKDPQAADWLGRELARLRPAAIISTLSFSAAGEDGASPLAAAGCPVLQATLALTARDAWEASGRGLGALDLAINVVLPERDGCLVTCAVSFKGRAPGPEGEEGAALIQCPEEDRIAFVADLAASWARLSGTPREERRLGIVLSDYPGRGARAGFALGLDMGASLARIVGALRAAGYEIGSGCDDGDMLLRDLSAGTARPTLSAADYAAVFAGLPEVARTAILSCWGAAEDDPDFRDGFFFQRFAVLGRLVVAVQPERAGRAERRQAYHDATLPPRHAYVAFYAWLRRHAGIHALVHMGAHGTLEWLPGKAVAPTAGCFPEAVLGPLPLVYPFIVSNPGEAVQARRRNAALMVGHLCPPVGAAGLVPELSELEILIDEYASAQGLDARRAALLADAIVEKVQAGGIGGECGLSGNESPGEVLARVDSWLCDVKDLSIREGLHVFGKPLAPEARARFLAALGETEGDAARRLDSCAGAETEGLLAALDGRFVAPGPGGSPVRGRCDVLPTGRNLYAVDPRAIPTRTASILGEKAGREFLRRYMQDHGDWPRAIILDLWAGSQVRTGGEDMAQALFLMGARPLWAGETGQVTGVEILPLAALDRPRVDVTLRISGLFRDLFPAQVDLFDRAVRAIAARDEDGADNPLARATRRDGGVPLRIFGAAPGAYGAGVAERIAAGNWEERVDLAAAYVAATSHAYGPGGEGAAAPGALADRLRVADAILGVQDEPGRDLLDGDAVADHAGGAAAAAHLVQGRAVPVYRLDASDPHAPRARTLGEDVARVVRGRLANPRWLTAQMRHGYSGAGEIARAVASLFAMAATSGSVSDRHFEIVHDAIVGDAAVWRFVSTANPAAARELASRLDEAVTRRLWRPLRNATGPRLAALARGEP